MARLLVVEDADDQRMIITARLKKAGHAVVDVASGQDALRVVTERGLPEVAILDVGLPDIDGTALLTRLRALPGGTGMPAIFLSASVTPDDIARGQALGARYLTKPFVANALFAAIDRLLAETNQVNLYGW